MKATGSRFRRPRPRAKRRGRRRGLRFSRRAAEGGAVGANGSMLSSVVRIALEELVAHKGRSVLTMLGIVVGVAAVIAMVSLGQGAQQQVQQQIASMGTNMLI